MGLLQNIVWTVSCLGYLVTFGISYWATTKFHNIVAQIGFCFIAVIVGNLAYISAWPLFSMLLFVLHLVNVQDFQPFAVEVGRATGVHGWKELGGSVVVSAAGFVVAARRAKKSEPAN